MIMMNFDDVFVHCCFSFVWYFTAVLLPGLIFLFHSVRSVILIQVCVHMSVIVLSAFLLVKCSVFSILLKACLSVCHCLSH